VAAWELFFWHKPALNTGTTEVIVDSSDLNAKSASADPYIEIVADLVSAYVSNNSIRPADLPDFIASVHASIRGLGKGQVEAAPAAPPVPAVPVKKSLTQDHIICLEDGKKFRSLKRHLGTVYNMTPDEYRAKWGLPKDYPMVAPGYSEIRSKLAKDIGLGQARGEPEPKPAAAGRRRRAAAG
jgi:predicted transcriptional regulator